MNMNIRLPRIIKSPECLFRIQKQQIFNKKFERVIFSPTQRLLQFERQKSAVDFLLKFDFKTASRTFVTMDRGTE